MNEHNVVNSKLEKFDLQINMESNSTTIGRYNCCFFLCFLSLFPFLANSQEVIGMSVSAGKAIHVHPKYTVSIFSDVTNAGAFGSEPNATILFSGKRWNNNDGSTMPDESASGVNGVGGNFKFANADMVPQYINSQSNPQGSSGFPNMSIANAQDVYIMGSDMAVRNNLNFEAGHLVLNNTNVILGSTNNNGSISGYNENSYVVTGIGTSGGGLVRYASGQAQTDIVFPIGTTVSSYTPASLVYKGIPQLLNVRVFDNVYENAISGAIDNVDAVNKTWNLVMSTTDLNATVTFSMQHNSNEENSMFTTIRPLSFISRYQSLVPNWDIKPATGVTPGVITSGNAIPNAFVSSRANIGKLGLSEYFSKWVRNPSLATKLRIPGGISPNNDGLNDKFVIQNLTNAKVIALEIYNPDQRLVFKDDNYKNTFEGVGNQDGFANTTLPIGTYFYIIKINDEAPFRGFIVINK